MKRLSDISKSEVSGCPWWNRATDRLLAKVYDARILGAVDSSLSVSRELTPIPVVEALKHYTICLKSAENWIWEWKKKKREENRGK